ncbi:LamG domain-containing protein [Mucilaginibacter sp. Bleaf8]|uniref:LamG domain-containing protein n=1 Tax=Mucilaginibacter sp. Bleaf8 TaxID=2834430 RepID=UPI001BCCA357|nr:LamG domain-containing protein [Mucilaginibacter sp. Bleaf8]MBS7563198.1 LamG domain-containing protein [Mucilaginibacter sp. Bleaf8]
MMASCKKDKQEADYNANKQELKRLTDSITQVYAQAPEGRDIGQYPKQARADLKQAVDMAASVNNGQFTQQEVNNAYASLRRAISAFNARQIAEVASQNLIAKWLFNGNAQDATANHNDGILMSGIIGTEGNHTDGGTLPVLTTDRFGQDNRAYELSNGAYIEVPYKTALNPDMLSISMWIKPKEQFGDNYIMSLNRWNGFKFQLQADNFLFMTLKTPAATFDKDSNPGKMVTGEWHHAVVTVGNGAITFYVDGVQVKTESLAGTAAKLAAPVNLAIGQQLPKDQFNFTDTSNPNYFYSGSYFKGALDDIRYYNKVLSTTEVTSIYNNEKPD